MTTRSALWLRRTELALWGIGLALLAAALATSAIRWRYQSEQEEALAQMTANADPPAPATGDISRPWALEAGTDSAGAAHPAAPLLPAELGPHEGAAASGARASEVLSGVPNSRAGEAPAPHQGESALDPGVIGQIEIPRLGVQAIVREGDDEETLDRAIGLVPGTARPGDGGNTALAGHRDTFFRPLRRIEVGDVIRLEVPGQTYAYRVAETRVVDPDEVSVLESRGTEELTLLTCYPFRWIGPAPERFVVRATRMP